MLLHQIEKIIFFVIFMSFTLSAQARFEYTQDASGNWVAETTTKAREGLGQIIRDMGLEPNWSDRKWVSQVRDLNPTVINSSGHVIKPGQTLIIPFSALDTCQGYGKLLSSVVDSQPIGPVNGPILEPAPIQEPVAVEQAPVKTKLEDIPPPPPEPAPAVTEELQHRFFAGSIWLGLGTSVLSNAEDVTGTNTDLSPPFSYHLGLILELNFTPKLGLFLNARMDNRDFEKPNNLDLDLDEANLLSFGGDLGYWFGRTFRFGIFGESTATPISELSSPTEIQVRGNSLITAGASLKFAFQANAPRDLVFWFKPGIIMGDTISNIEYNDGLSLRSLITYRLNGTNFTLGLEHNYQSIKHSAAKNTLHDIFARVGYNF